MTGPCVLDASAALSALSANQSTPAARTYFSTDHDWLCPSVFRIEVRSALVRLERRGAFPAGDADDDLALLESAIRFAEPPDTQALSRTLALSRTHRLGVYDALYLDLALTSGAALASRDGPLLDAGRELGLKLFDLR